MGPQRVENVEASDTIKLLELNALRADGSLQRRCELEAEFNRRFGADRYLAVYGSLAPGRSNHAQLSALSGTWSTNCHVTGELIDQGWGAGIGFPALRWSESGAPVPVQLFESDELAQHWDRLDAFEGPEYLRILVPVLADGHLISIANLYAARPAGLAVEK